MTVPIGNSAPVSAVVLAYNSEAYLAQAITSLLTQSVPLFQIIVVDDGSQDQTAEIAQSFGDLIEYVAQPTNHGIPNTLNCGISHARGEFITFLDGDDLSTRSKIEKLLGAFAQNPSLDLALGYVEHFISSEVSAEQQARIECPTQPMPGYVYGALLARRALFDRVGPFGTHWRVGHFVDWFTRAQDAGLNLVLLPDIVLRRRLHGENIGLREPRARRDFVLAVKAARDRRRIK